VARTATSLAIGPSSLEWDGSALTIRIEEVTAPLPSRIRGTVRVIPSGITSHAVQLDAAGRHRWWPIAPCSRIEVALERPGLTWSGPAYLDTNDGDAPLEQDFTLWNWSRAPLRRGTAVLYEASHRGGGDRLVSIRCDPGGTVEEMPPPPTVQLPATRWWRMPRVTRADGPAGVVKTLEDAPFYSRSVLSTRIGGESATAVHESLSLDRFARPAVQMLLPFRVPRALG